ncbi:MAG: DNA gyrase inhibitor YacG [Robiginitomaculum sp.]|nr:MAG: DNA gyrase inhibitor YacG [Robiginitomaculum sp.]
MSTPVKCPICKKPTDPAHKPFCCERCQQVDLGRWLKGGYVVPGRPEDDSEQLPDEQERD